MADRHHHKSSSKSPFNGYWGLLGCIVAQEVMRRRPVAVVWWGVAGGSANEVYDGIMREWWSMRIFGGGVGKPQQLLIDPERGDYDEMLARLAKMTDAAALILNVFDAYQGVTEKCVEVRAGVRDVKGRYVRHDSVGKIIEVFDGRSSEETLYQCGLPLYERV